MSIHVAAATSAIAFVIPTPVQMPGEQLSCVRKPVLLPAVLVVCVHGPGVGGQSATAWTWYTVYATTVVNVTCALTLLPGTVVVDVTGDEIGVPGRVPPSVIEIVG